MGVKLPGTDTAWAGIIAFVLAVGISLSLATCLIIAMLRPTPVDQQLADVVTTLYASAVGAIAAYLGFGRGGSQGGGGGASPPAS